MVDSFCTHLNIHTRTPRKGKALPFSPGSVTVVFAMAESMSPAHIHPRLPPLPIHGANKAVYLRELKCAPIAHLEIELIIF